MRAGTRSIEVASLSDVGRVRAVNQDRCGERGVAGGGRLLVLCDGMGGHAAGEVASQLAVDTITEVVAAGGLPPDLLLRRAFEEASARIRARAAEERSVRGMGTTGVALLLDGRGAAWVAHVGDSRAYRLRAGRIEPLTEDHSVVAQQLRAGLITAEQAERLPHNELLRAIGQPPPLEVDVARIDALPGDRFLLCSDGLWNVLGDSELAEIVGRESPADAVLRLVDAANERGTRDNVTAQVASVGAALGPAPGAAARWVAVAAALALTAAAAACWLLRRGGD